MDKVNINNEYVNIAASENTNSYEPSPERTQLATITNRLFLIATAITNVNDTDEALIFAGILNLAAGLLVLRAAVLEAEEQQIAPGVTTFANKLKLIGAFSGLIVSLILFWALLIEVEIKSSGADIGVNSPIAGATGSLFL